jgi:polyphosphate kinase 2
VKKAEYRPELLKLQIELVKLQRHIIAHGDRILVIFEGRDAAGKDGTIKHITEHMSPRETRVVALGPPSSREESQWYFERFVRHLPDACEMVLFNRSWYNRAGVERVMGFCSKAQTREFLEVTPGFEAMLVRSGMKLFKYYLDISRHEQKRRLKERAKDPLKQWKLSPVDAKAMKHWEDYSKARNQMLARTHTEAAPWTIVRADDKEPARLNVIRDLLSRLDYKHRDKRLIRPDRDIVRDFDSSLIESGMIAP